MLNFEDDFHLTGTYSTAVSSNGKPINEQPIHGSWQRTPVGDILLSWSVQWIVPMKDGTTRYSTTCWSGILKFRANQFETTWLLTSADEPAWRQTIINKDVFTLILSE